MKKKGLDFQNLTVEKTFLNLKNIFTVFSIVLFFILSDIAFGITGYMGSGLNLLGKVLLLIFSTLPMILAVIVRRLTKIVTSEVKKQVLSATSLRIELERIATQINRLEGKMLKLKSNQTKPVLKEDQVEPNLNDYAK